MCGSTTPAVSGRTGSRFFWSDIWLEDAPWVTSLGINQVVTPSISRPVTLQTQSLASHLGQASGDQPIYPRVDSQADVGALHLEALEVAAEAGVPADDPVGTRVNGRGRHQRARRQVLQEGQLDQVGGAGAEDVEDARQADAGHGRG